MAELKSLTDITRCPMLATASNRFSVELPSGGTTTLTPEQMQVAATVRVAEALERLLLLAEAGLVPAWLGELKVSTPTLP